jgi:hypothetical protein
MTGNRAARRREQAERRRRAATWKRLIKQGGGCYAVTIWRVGGPVPDPVACEAIISWTRAVATGELVDPLCGCCDRRPVPPAAFAVLAPFVDAAPEAVSVSGICPACAARSNSGLTAAVTAVMKRDVFHDLRPLQPVHMHAGGRA